MSRLDIRPGMPLDVDVLTELNKGRLVNKYTFTDTTLRQFDTGWGQGMITPIISKETDTDIILDWRVPSRNDSSGWGGMYMDIQYSEDGGGTWTSIGNSGYDGGCMVNGADGIGSMSGHHVFTNLSTETIRIRMMHRSYEGTVTINDGRGESGVFYCTMYIKEVTK